MVSKGATTSWERWDTDIQDGGMNGESQKILSGNLEAWCYQTLGGINYDPERPGFKHIILRPRPVGDLTFVRAAHRSLYGPIESDWKIEGGAFLWNVAVPPNTTATVYVPARDAAAVTEGGEAGRPGRGRAVPPDGCRSRRSTRSGRGRTRSVRSCEIDELATPSPGLPGSANQVRVTSVMGFSRMPSEPCDVHPSNTLNRPIDPGVATVSVCRIHGSESAVQSDELAVEEPLEIRLGYDEEGRHVVRSISITMRTPGHDQDLAVGFLFTEGILTTPEQVAGIRDSDEANAVLVELQPEVTVDLGRLERHFYTSSSCGVCGKVALEAVRVTCPIRLADDQPVVEASVIPGLPETLRAAQAVFERTGGLHASALFDTLGNLLGLREDVGRHNALDKLIGAQFLAGGTPLSQNILLVSGRASFELVQKAAVAGIPILAAVGAPFNPGGRSRPRARHDGGRLRPPGPIQHLHRGRPDPSRTGAPRPRSRRALISMVHMPAGAL